jgi:hypothetical protein
LTFLTSIKKRLALLFAAFAEAVGSFLDVAAARLTLAFYVLMGWSPPSTDSGRFWNRAIEVPVIVHIKQWSDQRILYSILVWPATEYPEEDAREGHQHRVDAIKEAVAKGASEKMWSVQFETGPLFAVDATAREQGSAGWVPLSQQPERRGG